MDYTYGLNKIYLEKEIDKANQSPSFGREYDLQYLVLLEILSTHRISIGP